MWLNYYICQFLRIVRKNRRKGQFLFYLILSKRHNKIQEISDDENVDEESFSCISTVIGMFFAVFVPVLKYFAKEITARLTFLELFSFLNGLNFLVPRYKQKYFEYLRPRSILIALRYRASSFLCFSSLHTAS